MTSPAASGCAATRTWKKRAMGTARSCMLKSSGKLPRPAGAANARSGARGARSRAALGIALSRKSDQGSGRRNSDWAWQPWPCRHTRTHPRAVDGPSTWSRRRSVTTVDADDGERSRESAPAWAAAAGRCPSATDCAEKEEKRELVDTERVRPPAPSASVAPVAWEPPPVIARRRRAGSSPPAPPPATMAAAMAVAAGEGAVRRCAPAAREVTWRTTREIWAASRLHQPQSSWPAAACHRGIGTRTQWRTGEAHGVRYASRRCARGSKGELCVCVRKGQLCAGPATQCATRSDVPTPQPPPPPAQPSPARLEAPPCCRRAPRPLPAWRRS